jgi:competence protein ComEC
MMKKTFTMSVLAFALIFLQAPAYGKSAKPLTIYAIDVGPGVGNATLVVSPSGQSMMLDAGSTFTAQRVLEAIREAGVKRIDYMVVTHYHSDHFGGVPYLAQHLQIVNFVDHGPTVEYGRNDAWWKARREPWFHPGMGERYDDFYDTYLKVRATGHHLLVKPGDKIPIRGINVTVLTAGEKELTHPLPGAGEPNPACADVKLRQEDDAEDGQSIGVLITYGKFRFVYLGDLTWNPSYRLFCPDNKVGAVDAYIVTHHGMSLVPALGPYSLGTNCCNKAEVYGLHPRVAILSVGPLGWRGNGNGDSLQTVRSSPGLEDMWQTNYLVGGGLHPYTSDKKFCANIGTTGKKAEFIKLDAEPNGSFTITNSRNQFSKSYPAR